MAHRIDAEQDQDGGQGAVVTLRPGSATTRSRPGVQPIPLRPAEDMPRQRRKPLWDKNNFGFWLAVCVLISLAFSIAWRAIG